MTDWFNVDSGLKQGCILSSIMFNIYVNSLIDDIKNFELILKFSNLLDNNDLFIESYAFFKVYKGNICRQFTLLPCFNN
jgi:hypothetical protein